MPTDPYQAAEGDEDAPTEEEQEDARWLAQLRYQGGRCAWCQTTIFLGVCARTSDDRLVHHDCWPRYERRRKEQMTGAPEIGDGRECPF